MSRENKQRRVQINRNPQKGKNETTTHATTTDPPAPNPPHFPLR